MGGGSWIVVVSIFKFYKTSNFPAFSLIWFWPLFLDYEFISAEFDHLRFDPSYGFGSRFLDGYK